MSLAQEQSQLTLNDCGCCEGLAVETPVEVNNRPGLSTIAYRVGIHAQFKASMLARLSGSGLPELGNLKTRDDDDFTIALLDGWALVADVLTFYQERIANESYLRTATERSSIINLSRLIGYQLRPGVAANTYLAFTLESGEGAPEAVMLEPGLQVQSIPGPDETPQTFETIEQVAARVEWGEMKPRLSELVLPASGSTSTYLAGVTTNLKKGDLLLFAEQQGDAHPGSKWDIRRVSAVEIDADNERTLVRLAEALKSFTPPVAAGQRQLKVYAMRLRASLFGYNAPAWKTLPAALQTALGGTAKEEKWVDARFARTTEIINLDSVYPEIILESWVVLTKRDSTSDDGTKPPGKVGDVRNVYLAHSELYRVKDVAEEAKADFNIAAKTTRLKISGANRPESPGIPTPIEMFAPRDTSVAAQSEELLVAESPITDPVCNDSIVLEQLITPLAEGRSIIISGRRLRARIETALALTSSDDPSVTMNLKPGDELFVLGPWPLPEGPGLKLMDRNGFAGFLDVPGAAVTPIPANEKDPVISEVATIKATAAADDNHSKLILTRPLGSVFDRASVTINANVALATHGETVANEVLGSGAAGEPYQNFKLHQSPLTFRSADTPAGGESTLEVRVNDLRWNEVPTLFGHGPRERIYITRTDDDKTTTVQFGDGKMGARLPTGQENVTATYRKGIGLEGLVDAGQLSLLMTRPLGVKDVINPLAPGGAQDPQNLADARANSPITVLTLDRIVSLRDYEDFARAFSGIAKALATWTWNIHSRGVLVTVAGIDGVEVDSVLRDRLVSAMLKVGDAHVPVTIKSYRSVTFKLAAQLKVDADYIQKDVLASVEKALRSAFSFAARAFGQPVTLSEVIAVMQSIAGVVAVDINRLHRSTGSVELRSFLAADAPGPGDAATVLAAELLTLEPGLLDLGVMP